MIADSKSPFRLKLPLLKRSDYRGEGTFVNMAALFDTANELTSARATYNLMLLAREVDGFLDKAAGVDLFDVASREELAEAINTMHAVQLRLQCWNDQALEQHEQACAEERKHQDDRLKIMEIRRNKDAAA